MDENKPLNHAIGGIQYILDLQSGGRASFRITKCALGCAFLVFGTGWSIYYFMEEFIS